MHEGGDRDQQYALLQATQARQGQQALGEDVLVRRKHVIGQTLPIGKRQQGDISLQSGIKA